MNSRPHPYQGCALPLRHKGKCYLNFSLDCRRFEYLKVRQAPRLPCHCSHTMAFKFLTRLSSVRIYKRFGQRWIRTTVLSREQIYSLSPLATRPSTHIKLSIYENKVKLLNSTSRNKPMMGLEPATYGLQNRCSTIELHRHISIYYCGHGKLSSNNFCKFRLILN